MKKSLASAFACLLLMLPTAQAVEMTPLQLGIWGPSVQVPSAREVIGLRLNLVMSDTEAVTGIDVGFVGMADTTTAVQVNLYNETRGMFSGIGVGLFNRSLSMAGLQAGLFNMTDGDVTGLQAGLFNNANTVNGLQIGLFNRTGSMRGVQIGLINIIEDGPLMFFPVLNAAF